MELKSEEILFEFRKYRASHNTIRKVIHYAQEITDNKKIINNHIFSFYKKLFEELLQDDSKELLEFLKDISIPSLTEEQKKIFEGENLSVFNKYGKQ